MPRMTGDSTTPDLTHQRPVLSHGAAVFRDPRIVISFIGHCQLGPWNGQELAAELAMVRLPNGRYRHSGSAWLCEPRPPEKSPNPSAECR
jgi:hypothetical protein